MRLRDRRRLIVVALIAIGIAPPTNTAGERPALGPCPADTRRLDSFISLLCEGETALNAGQYATALKKNVSGTGVLPAPKK